MTLSERPTYAEAALGERLADVRRQGHGGGGHAAREGGAAEQATAAHARLVGLGHRMLHS
jgi:hypothetical protein